MPDSIAGSSNTTPHALKLHTLELLPFSKEEITEAMLVSFQP